MTYNNVRIISKLQNRNCLIADGYSGVKLHGKCMINRSVKYVGLI